MRQNLLRAEAKRLAAKGAQVVEADALDPASLRAAFEGAYGVFATLPLHGGGGFEDGYKLELDQGANVYGICVLGTAADDHNNCHAHLRNRVTRSTLAGASTGSALQVRSVALLDMNPRRRVADRVSHAVQASCKRTQRLPLASRCFSGASWKMPRSALRYEAGISTGCFTDAVLYVAR